MKPKVQLNALPSLMSRNVMSKQKMPADAVRLGGFKRRVNCKIKNKQWSFNSISPLDPTGSH